jgi:hypothetical protein
VTDCPAIKVVLELGTENQLWTDSLRKPRVQRQTQTSQQAINTRVTGTQSPEKGMFSDRGNQWSPDDGTEELRTKQVNGETTVGRGTAQENLKGGTSGRGRVNREGERGRR